jgi:NDP-sugar pyrophosphorylase family protein
MRAFVMSAGLGTRLRPLTDWLPKPLVPLKGRPMVEYILNQLEAQGFDEARLNIHYLPEKMIAFVDKWNARGKKLKLSIQDESDKILGSGGALSRASDWLFEKSAFSLVCNADVIANPNFSHLLEKHKKLREQGVETTLAVMPHPLAGKKYNGLKVKEDLVLGFEKSEKEPLFHFPGFYVVDEKCKDRFLPDGIEYSVVEKIWEPLAKGKKLGAWQYSGSYFDLGTVEDLRLAEKSIS